MVSLVALFTNKALFTTVALCISVGVSGLVFLFTNSECLSCVDQWILIPPPGVQH